MIHITPPQSAPDFIKRSSLAQEGSPLGWIMDRKDRHQLCWVYLFGLINEFIALRCFIKQSYQKWVATKVLP